MLEMDKYIELNDEFEEYALDELDCFQRPVCIVINSIKSKVEDAFILYSKALEIYTNYNLKEIRYSILDFIFELGLEVNKSTNRNIYSFIENEIDNGKLIILGIDYSGLFYSRYYKEQNYPHWIIINGYDRRKEIFSIYDYTQFLDNDFKFKPFALNYKYIKELNKKYVNNYGNDDSLFSISKSRTIKNTYDIHIKTISYVLLRMKEKNYSLISVFREMILLKNSLKNIDLSEYEALVINLSKSRKLFIAKMIKIMELYKYDKRKIEDLICLSRKIENEYYNFTSICIVKIMTDKYQNIKFKDSIKEFEQQLIEYIEDFYNYLKTYKVQENIYIESHKETLNDVDRVISVKGEIVCFDFICNKDYNWWDYDNSPKFSVVKLENCNYFEITTTVEVLHYQENNKFQMGFVLYNGINYYTCMIDVDDKFCIDKIGVDNFSCHIPFSILNKIYMQIENGYIIFGTYDGDVKKKILKREIGRISNGYIGLVCKKWGEYGELAVRFSNLKYYLQ